MIEAERDSLLSVKEATTHHSLEMEKLLCRVTSLSKEKEELQKMVQALEEEKQLRTELGKKVEMVNFIFYLREYVRWGVKLLFLK